MTLTPVERQTARDLIRLAVQELTHASAIVASRKGGENMLTALFDHRERATQLLARLELTE